MGLASMGLRSFFFFCSGNNNWGFSFSFSILVRFGNVTNGSAYSLADAR